MTNIPHLQRAIRRQAAYARRGYRFLQPPLKIVMIDPQQIDLTCRFHRQTQKRFGSKLHDLGRLRGGDWDQPRDLPINKRFAGMGYLESVTERYLNGVPWCGRAHDLIRARISGHLKSMT